MSKKHGRVTDADLMDGRWIPMQFTGIYDTTDKEIYEGDVVKVDFPGTFTGSIEYEAPEWRMKRKSGELWRFADCPTVIGNIYENPELIHA